MVSGGKGKGKGKEVWKPFPRMSQLPLLSVVGVPNSNYALSIMKGLAGEAFVESAGRECMVPGHVRPVTLGGLQLWPVDINWNFMKPITREIGSVGKFMDVAFGLMQAPFGDR